MNDFCIPGYDYSTREMREETVAGLFARAVSARSGVEREWQRCNDYYNFSHDVGRELRESGQTEELNWLPAAMPDAWIIVESQVDPNVPEPQFHGRDNDMDSQKARQREYAVRYIAENNRLTDMNTRNERRLLKYGDAFWKAYWDSEMRCGIQEGDIRIRDIPVDAIYPDPAVTDGSLQDGQYVDYVYRIHKVAFLQRFRRDLEALGLEAEDILNLESRRHGVFDLETALDRDDDTVEVLEHWFRQPAELTLEGEVIPEGAVGCCILAGGHELRYIPNYWKRTARECSLFPFVHYWRVQDENRFWNKSELFPVLELIDAADRKLAMGILGDAYMSNDIILVEEGALADGEVLTNEPGTILRCKPNRSSQIRRLGGVQSLANAAVGLEWYKEQIERASRCYEISRGKEAVRTSTASGLAMLRTDAENQENIKRSDRNRGFERLYELLDALALEFFDDDRMLWLGADERSGRKATAFRFNSLELTEHMGELTDMNGRVVREGYDYYPRVDVTITAGDSVMQSKQATLETLQTLSAANITPENWKLYAAQLELLNIPEKQEIIEEWRERFALNVPAAETEETII
ncbi:MAG: hypothetical protein MJ074_03875 [Oscillospiraceae bacterium]|nr:hypothetical protein [Oscillospiraceae bacterium]